MLNLRPPCSYLDFWGAAQPAICKNACLCFGESTAQYTILYKTFSTNRILTVGRQLWTVIEAEGKSQGILFLLSVVFAHLLLSWLCDITWYLQPLAFGLSNTVTRLSTIWTDTVRSLRRRLVSLYTHTWTGKKHDQTNVLRTTGLSTMDGQGAGSHATP
ncbi:uncharacterized protein FTOL_10069 [Fusarium torulosum]|uniref:Uncharacterized protein n=1 Tax=Fusarium torulosum TaxID=33205 RepID=A0AAE8MGB3_9HYPO|nr:uncharacterized protein FTOL_10069 [Fusarium torulosum]